MSEAIRIMVADENEHRGQQLAQALTGMGYPIVGVASAGAYLPTLVADAEPDLILINTNSPDRDTLEQLSLIDRDRPRPVVMFADDDNKQTIEAAVRAGVWAYVTEGVGEAKVRTIIDVAVVQFQQHQALRKELARTKADLDERKAIDRAKGLLMQRRGLSEAEAFAELRKEAMDQKKRIGQVASDLIQVAGLLDQSKPRLRSTGS